MKIKIGLYALTIVLLTLIQTTLLDYFRFLGVKPNLLLIFIIVTAVIRGNNEGAAVGFFAGLAHDLVTGKVLGFYALLGLYLGLLIGLVNRKLYKENIFITVFFTFIGSIVYESMVYIFSFVGSIFTGNDMVFDYSFAFLNYILPESVYNIIAAIFIYIIVVKLHKTFEYATKSSRKY